MLHILSLFSFSKDRYLGNESNISCIFPDEFQQYEWYSLNQTIQMFIKNNDIELINSKQSHHNQRFHCLQLINSTDYRIRMFINWYEI